MEFQERHGSLNHSEREAALMIGISRSSLQRARLRGDIAFYRLRGRVLYSETHIQDFLRRSERRRMGGSDESLSA